MPRAAPLTAIVSTEPVPMAIPLPETAIALAMTVTSEIQRRCVDRDCPEVAGVCAGASVEGE